MAIFLISSLMLLFPYYFHNLLITYFVQNISCYHKQGTNLLMGSSLSNQQITSSVKIIDEWKTVEHLNDFSIVKRRDKEVYGEMRKFKLDPIYEPKKQLAIYKMRKNLGEPTVGILAAEKVDKISKFSKDSKDNTCLCGNNNFFTVISERIPIRLESLFQVTFPQNLYILSESLKGFKQLFTKVGPIHVTNRMIGLNQEGKCKVWVNQDWSQNHPSSSINFLLSSWNPRDDKQYSVISPELREQREMVENIVDVIEEKCQIGRFPGDFRNEIRKNLESFGRTLDFIEKYVRRNRIYVADRIMDSLVRTSPEQMQRIQERYQEYQNQETKEQRQSMDGYRVRELNTYFDSSNRSFMNYPPQNTWESNKLKPFPKTQTSDHSSLSSNQLIEQLILSKTLMASIEYVNFSNIFEFNEK